MPNWAKLVRDGRAKAMGVPWSEQEAKARELGIPAEYVRSGILTIAEYEKAKTADQKNGVKIVSLPSGETVREGAPMNLGGIEVSVTAAAPKKGPKAPKAPKVSKTAAPKKGGDKTK